MGGRFHFVCHECTEEGVYSDRTEAVAAQESHVEETDHRVSLEDIADPVA